jgi:hypothetical protein
MDKCHCCHCNNECSNSNKSEKNQKEEVKDFLIKTIESVDSFIPIIGPFMDIFIIDKIEKELVNVFVDIIYSHENKMDKDEDFMIFSA